MTGFAGVVMVTAEYLVYERLTCSLNFIETFPLYRIHELVTHP